MMNDSKKTVAGYVTGRTAALLLLLILALGLFLRLYVIEITPLEYDESIWGNVARNVIERGEYCRSIRQHPIFVDHPPMHTYQIGLSFLLFGISPVTLRIPTIILSLLTVVLFYRLYRVIDLPGKETGAILLAFSLVTAPHALVMSRNSHVEITVAFYGIASLLVMVMYRQRPRWFLLTAAGILFSLSVFSKFLGLIYGLPLLVLLFLRPCVDGKKVEQSRFGFAKRLLLFLPGILVVTLAINYVLATQIPFDMKLFYQGVQTKFLDVVLHEDVAKAPWRDIDLGKFVTSLHRHFYPIFLLGFLAGLLSFGQFLHSRLMKGERSSSTFQILVREQILFWSASLFFLLLCFSSGATRNIHYTWLAIPLYAMVMISVFFRLWTGWAQRFEESRAKSSLVRIVGVLLFVSLSFQGVYLEKPYRFQADKKLFPKLAYYIDVNTRPRQTVVIDPYGPEIAFLANRTYDILYTCESLGELYGRLEKAHGVVLKRTKLPLLTESQMVTLRGHLNERFNKMISLGDYDLFFKKKKNPAETILQSSQ